MKIATKRGVFVRYAERLKPELATPAHDLICEWVDRNSSGVVAELFPSAPFPVQVGHVRWEVPLLSRTRTPFPVGVVDLVIPVRFYERNNDSRDEVCLCRATPEPTPWNFCRGTGYHCQTCLLIIEAKPKIASVGAVLRQVNLYKHGDLEGMPRLWERCWAVASPDEQWRQRVQSQGVYFITAPRGTDLGHDEYEYSEEFLDRN